MNKEVVQVVGSELSLRVPDKKNPYQCRFVEVGEYTLPLVSADALYLPRICMRELVQESGHDFPCHFSKQMAGRIDIFVSEEGFLIPFTHLEKSDLHILQARILMKFAAYTVAYDVVRLDAKNKGVIHALRLVPWSTCPWSEERIVDHETWEILNRRADEILLSYVKPHRTAKLSTFAVRAIRAAILPAPLPRKKYEQQAEAPEHDVEESPVDAPQRCEVTDVSIRLCNAKDIEARIEREPSRNNNSGGSLPTLAKLCEEKSLVGARDAHVKAVAELHDKLPNFSPVIDYLRRKLQAQQLCGNPIRMPPILLVGDPGVGKSYFCRKLTGALNMPFEFISVAGSSQELHITGLSKNWGTAGPSRFAEILAGSQIGNPLIMVDEIDKASDIKVENALLQVFEPETAARWIDQYVEVPIDLSRVLFIATANDETQLSPVLLSRFEVFEIKKPEDAALAAVFGSIYADEKQQFRTAKLFSERLPNEVVEKLIQSAMTPREARRMLINAMELAIIRTHQQLGNLRQGSVVVQPDDMPSVRRVEPSNRIGFI